MRPIDTRQPGDAVRAYSTILNWPLSVGHRYRPRQGCTCGEANCPTPGAHPLPCTPPSRDEAQLEQDLKESPGAALLAWTQQFDAVAVRRPVGMAAMATLESIAPVPCLLAGNTAILLVQPATGQYALREGLPGRVRSGPERWIAVPPAHGMRWDTRPWVDETSAPVDLLHGAFVGQHLLRAYAGTENLEARL
ncbi:hypothetical protein ACIP93_32855 [Streptomyces sp. NPDC088745]|uniref:hypothetical protein n=1 Tax=Streptomyces sp. NPDC088745 TaxID=3365884 RepID=UPI0037F50F2A